MGGAKSWGLCGEAIRECIEVDNNRVLLARKELVTFRRSTLVTLQQIIPPSWNHHKAELFYEAPNGSELHYSGLGTDQDIAKLKSTEWGMIGIDEASDIAYETLLMAGARLRWKPAADVKRLKLRLTSNPEQCWLKDVFIDTPRPGYRFIPALPSDNPYLPPEYVADLREMYGNDPAWEAAYLEGSWDAIEDARQVIPSAALLLALKEPLPVGNDCVWGVDVARYGKDKTVIVEWRPDSNGYGPIRVIDSWHHLDTYQSKDRLLALYRSADPQPRLINVDVVGLGAGVVDAGKHERWEEPADPNALAEVSELKRQRLPIRGVNSGERAAKPELFRNRRAEMAWTIRNLAVNGKVSFPNDVPELKTELAAYRYEIVNDKVIALELKDKMRERLGRSPDYGDAVMLACGVVARTPYFGFIDESPKRDQVQEGIDAIREAVLPAKKRKPFIGMV